MKMNDYIQTLKAWLDVDKWRSNVKDSRVIYIFTK